MHHSRLFTLSRVRYVIYSMLGENTRKMRDGWTGYRQNYEEATNGRYHTQQDFHAYFMWDDHSFSKIREKFGIKRLETLHPNGVDSNENT